MAASLLLNISRKATKEEPSSCLFNEVLKAIPSKIDSTIKNYMKSNKEYNDYEFFFSIHFDEFCNISDGCPYADGDIGASIAGPAFQEFMRQNPTYKGFRIYMNPNRDESTLWCDWADATEGEALELRQKFDIIRLQKHNLEKRQKIIDLACEYMAKMLFSEKTLSRFEEFAKNGWRRAVFMEDVGMWEGDDLKAVKGANLYPREIMRTFISKYPKLKGFTMEYDNSCRLWAIWDNAPDLTESEDDRSDFDSDFESEPEDDSD